ncbi:hypothetical protein L873DRAFT_1924498 [Choiromyces venosus 120613-1]|uniref:Uncharacterized protein n=1 Tax=Choiromyces venosus 120613-1 TaxID=1336337 RepID=A0A3N4JE48_9PEZI|nr:hypothetical protein L873DRAFT_1924498 [Choiromyces venosus 120613-1]
MTMQQWMMFLEMVDEKAQLSDQELIICTKVIMFQIRATKASYVNAIKDDMAKLIQKASMSQARGNLRIENWSLRLTIGGFLPLIKSLGTVAVFTNAVEDMIELHATKVPSWHIYVIVYRNGVLAVYDPSFIPGTSTLISCTGVPLLKAVVKAFRAEKAHHKHMEIWFGGGGNDGRNCQEMTRKWIEEEIIIKNGKDVDNWNNREG